MRPSLLSGLDIFQGLSASDLSEVQARLQLRTIPRGHLLVRQGDPASELFVVISGRFRVSHAGRDAHIAEIGPGQPIGEIAFFRGGVRTANVIAARDSVVVALSRGDFEDVARRSPLIWPALTKTLATRLADSSLLATERQARSRPKTIAICAAGSTRNTAPVLRTLKDLLEPARRCVFVSSALLPDIRTATALDPEAGLTAFLNKLEEDHDYVVYVADRTLTPWTERTLRQADLVLWVADVADGAAPELNGTERFASDAAAFGEQWLILAHDKGDAAGGTAKWLAPRPAVTAHHHVALNRASDFQRLIRFIDGSALGLVACGGGAFCAAHIGTYQALREAGLEFDIMSGTSGGAAMAAAFTLGIDPDDITRLLEDMFVAKRAMRRWTWPKYSLLDHAVLDRELARHYTGINIEDLWKPFFAVSTNVTRGSVHYHRRGSLWKAIRASSSIPALLPPVCTEDGELLVDGCLLDNLPVRGMRSVKSGPNVLLELDVPSFDRQEVAYEKIPGRGELLTRLISPFGRMELPIAPSPHSVLMRSLMINRSRVADAITDQDLLLTLPIPQNFRHLDWRAHRDLRKLAYEHASRQLARLRECGHPLFAT